jgi:uncharacterized protein YyaL (SSP411 family)
MPDQNKNHLSGETSLYLIQHSNNPVNWYPWSDMAWEKAKKENKLVLISIGYSSCHWCHVMEKECFMDEKTARIMNDNFICIKVDREERPDIDQVYMNAVQLMTGSGGWPLNCFALPDGNPIYGGTYFPNDKWQEILLNLKDFYNKNPEKAAEYAHELTQGIHQSEIVSASKDTHVFSPDSVKKAIDVWKNYLDNTEGGPSRTPKFPLPNNYLFLLRYASAHGDSMLLDHVNLTLKKMAFGGIYDHLAGGFARYSTDSLWKIPHFEKMLYDNAQLISLYSSAYKLTRNDQYKNIAEETIQFLLRDMSDGEGRYFSAIDADSEGEEGKYYAWSIDEVKNIELPKCGKADPFKVFSDYFCMNDIGYWENKKYVLFRRNSDEEIATLNSVTVNELSDFILKAKSLLLKEREKREKPVTDKKIIVSWNCMQISALCSAYQAYGNESYRKEAIKSMNKILQEASSDEHSLLHVIKAKAKNVNGYMEDYAFAISALINLYEITFDERWLTKAKNFTDFTLKHFYDDAEGMFWFTSDLDERLIARKKEISDNVTSSSNSEMANALFKLNVLFEEKRYEEISTRMLKAAEGNISRYPSSYSNWLNLLMNFTNPTDEIVITGEKADEERKILSSYYLPQAIFCGKNDNKSNLPLLQNRFQQGKTLIYICRNKTCKLPVENSQLALTTLSAK